MRDGVDEGVVLRVASDFPDKKSGVQDHSRDDQHRQENAQEQQNPVAPVEQNPADVENYGDDDYAGAKSDEESNRFLAPGDDHPSSLSREWGVGSGEWGV